MGENDAGKSTLLKILGGPSGKMIYLTAVGFDRLKRRDAR